MIIHCISYTIYHALYTRHHTQCATYDVVLITICYNATYHRLYYIYIYTLYDMRSHVWHHFMHTVHTVYCTTSTICKMHMHMNIYVYMYTHVPRGHNTKICMTLHDMIRNDVALFPPRVERWVMFRTSSSQALHEQAVLLNFPLEEWGEVVRQ